MKARTKCEINVANKLDVRQRVDRGLERITLFQYSCYFIVSSVISIIAAINLFTVEVGVECWAGKGSVQ